MAIIMDSTAISFVLTFIFTLTLLIPLSHQVYPGTNCDNPLWDRFIKPSSDALEKYYLSMGTKNEAARKQEFLKAYNDGDVGLKNFVYNSLTGAQQRDEDFVKQETQKKLNTICLGIHQPFLYCRPDEGEKCTCNDQFPFETQTQLGRCKVKNGSICAMGEDFSIGCIESECFPGKASGTHYCGGQAAFEKRRREVLKQKRVEAGENAVDSDSDEDSDEDDDSKNAGGPIGRANLLALTVSMLLSLNLVNY